jgi:transposase-like protein
MVRPLERDLPELLAFFRFPKHLWRKLRTTNIIERCFVEVRRRTRPMVCFVNVQSVDRIIYSIFQRFNLEWKNRTLRGIYTSSLTSPSSSSRLAIHRQEGQTTGLT